MSKHRKPDESAAGASEVEVPPRFRGFLDNADREVARTLRDLGAAHIEYQDAKARYEEADRRLRAASKLAREAVTLQQEKLLEASRELELDDGTWSYDTLEGKMVRKDIDNG